MKVVFKSIEGQFFSFNDRNSISLPAGTYMLHYTKLTEEEWENGDRLDNLEPTFVGEIESTGEYTVLKTGAKVEFWCSGYNDYDRCDPYILKSTVTIT